MTEWILEGMTFALALGFTFALINNWCYLIAIKNERLSTNRMMVCAAAAWGLFYFACRLSELPYWIRF